MSNIISGIGRSNFYHFPGSQKEFYLQLKKSQILTSLWRTSDGADTLNSPKTLPVDFKSKAEVNHEVKNQFPEKRGFSLSVKQYTTYGKLVMNFYKEGVKNIWQNKKEMNKMINKEYKLGNNIDNKGRDRAIRIPSFSKLTSEMAQSIYMSKVENKTYSDETRGDIIRSDEVEQYIDTNLFNMTRQEYQLLKRTPKDWMKFPLFSAVLLVFFEMTPALCYIFPEITPSTCVLPSITPKLWSSSASLKLIEARKNVSPEDFEQIAFKSSYSLPLNEARLLAKSLRLISKYIPPSLYPESLVRRRLQNHYNFLNVDNYYLCGLNDQHGGNLWNLSKQELLLAALERGLVPHLKKNLEQINKIDDMALRSVKQQEFYDELRIKLMKFIVDFDKFNIGYLTISNSLEQPTDVNTIVKWRSS